MNMSPETAKSAPSLFGRCAPSIWPLRLTNSAPAPAIRPVTAYTRVRGPTSKVPVTDSYKELAAWAGTTVLWGALVAWLRRGTGNGDPIGWDVGLCVAVWAALTLWGACDVYAGWCAEDM